MSVPATKPLLGARPGTVLFTIGILLAWLSAGTIPFVIAYREAPASSDLVRDFFSAQALVRGERLSELDGPRGNAAAVAGGAQPVRIIGRSPFHLHPPPASLPMRVLVPLGFRGASIVWLALSVALLGVLAHLLGSVAGRFGARPLNGRVPLALFLALLVWPPVLTNLQLGQWSIVLATTIAAGFSAWERRRRASGAAWLATAAALKLTPLLLVPYLALRGRRPLAIYLAVLGGDILLAVPWGGGLDAWTCFFRDARTNADAWQTWWHNTLSINGLTARLLVGDSFARPFVHAPRVAGAVTVAVAGALVSVALAATWRSRSRVGTPAAEGCLFAAWNVLVVILNPIAWTHTALLLLLPAVLIWRASDEPGSPWPAVLRGRVRAAVAVAVLVLTIPKEALLILAGLRPPISPWRAPVLSAHLGAALLLFAAAIVAARTRRPGEHAGQIAQAGGQGQ